MRSSSSCRAVHQGLVRDLNAWAMHAECISDEWVRHMGQGTTVSLWSHSTWVYMVVSKVIAR